MGAEDNSKSDGNRLWQRIKFGGEQQQLEKWRFKLVLDGRASQRLSQDMVAGADELESAATMRPREDRQSGESSTIPPHESMTDDDHCKGNSLVLHDKKLTE